MSNTTSVVDGILEEISNYKGVDDKLLNLTVKLKDALALTGRDLSDNLVKKWSKKLEPLKYYTSVDICNVAHMLENQYRYHKNNEMTKKKEDNSAVIQNLQEVSSSLVGTAKNEVLDIITKLINEKELHHYYAYRGVNIQDEVIKLYDALKSKEFISIQPMSGPVGLIYFSLGDNYITTEAIEVVANTKRIDIDEKVNGVDIAKKIDSIVIHKIISLIPTINVNVIEDIKNIEEFDIVLVGKSTDNIRHNNIIVMSSLDEDMVILVKTGSNPLKYGMALCPYVPMLYMNDAEKINSTVMTRFGLKENPEFSRYFKVFKVT